MRILLIGPCQADINIPPIGWGAIEKILHQHQRGFEAAGHDVLLLNTPSTEKLKELITKDIDIIHCHHHWPLKELSQQNHSYIYTCHAAEWKHNWDYYGHHFRNTPWAMPFEAMADRVLSDNVYPIFNGADPKLFWPANSITPLSAVAVGKNLPRKRHAEIIALTQAHKEVTLTLIGPGNEIFEGEKQVTVLPNSTEKTVAATLNQADFFFQLSNEEADSLAVKEAAMAGCRLIVSKACATTFGKDYCWTQHDQFLKCPEILAHMAHHHAKNHYSWEHVITHILNGYTQLLENLP